MDASPEQPLPQDDRAAVAGRLVLPGERQPGGVTTETAALQQQLDDARKAEQSHRLILEAAGEGIYGLDLNGITTFANPAASVMTGWSMEEMVGKYQHAMIHHSHPDGSPYQREECPIYMALRDGLVHYSDSEVFWRKNGTCFPVAYTSTPILDGDRPVGAVVLFQNISERKRREEWERDKNSVFSAITSHLKLEVTFSKIASAFVALHPSLAVAFFSRSDSGLRMLAQTNLPQPLLSAYERHAAGASESICLRAADEGKEIVARRGNCGLDSSSCIEIAESLFDFCVAVPLISGSGQVLGTGAVFANGEDFTQEHALESVIGICDLARLAIEHQQLHTALVRQSQYDQLTGLPNRLLLEDRLEQAIMQARRRHSCVSVCYVDLDHFKQINDTLGHSAGDLFLQHVAKVLAASVREIDTVARQGGDEFILVLPDLESEEEAEEICHRILENLRQPVTLGEHTLAARASMGISSYPAAGDDVSTLLRSADTALYAAKKSGKGHVRRYDSALGENVQRNLALETALRSALENEQFSVAYQPLFDAGNELRGFEALLRWEHPELGSVHPEEFIPIAEEAGLIVPIGEWVLHQACRQAQKWNAESASPIRIFVNVSRVQLARPDIIDTVSRALSQSGLPAALLELEVTESCIITDLENTCLRLSRLRELGVSIAIDDFGTGHSSFSCLQRLPVDTLKIDRSFIARLDGTPGGSAIIRTIIALAAQLGLQVVAEGVETEMQYNELQNIRCSLLQGYLLARPLSSAASSTLVEECREDLPIS
jgi:diguanylate cyclase (GGDEF)-like protein/PAS domain S-box-containing protein